MGALRLDRLPDFLTSVELVVGLLWAGLAVFTVTLLFLMQTRWGQSRPLRKCIVLSVLAHLLLAGYATTVQIVSATPLYEEPVMKVSLAETLAEPLTGPNSPTERPSAEKKPWERLVHDPAPQPIPIDPQREEPEPSADPQRLVKAEQTSLPGEFPPDHLELSDNTPPQPHPTEMPHPTGMTLPSDRSLPSKSAEEIEVPKPQRREIPPIVPPDQPTPERRAPENNSELPPVRTFRNDLPAALIQQDVPLPSLTDRTTTEGPADSLAELTDRSPLVNSLGGRRAEIDASPEAPSGNTSVVIIPRPSPPQPLKTGPVESPRQLPNIYKLRVAPDRSVQAERRGATPQSEAAVKAALKWLADNQDADGRWDADKYGAGQELMVAGRNRLKAGIRADTGVTGLALLAFLASGHTHRDGLYRENVRRGMVYLLRKQADDGNLGGQASPYAKMYCHSIATLALSEALGMTADERLREPVEQAISYCISAQHPTLGGWRYLPGDPGDTSQCGWQLMALKSAELAGISIPVQTRNGVIRYLRTVASGKYGGLASYRPGDRASPAMTAEALACWQFLGMPRDNPAGEEAGDYILGRLPGQQKTNLYYWYYATLSMYQLQGDHWETWNKSLQTTLVESQQTTGPLAGSWDPDTVWGSYGGRVYSTALATLCLEVYYRFLPLYLAAGKR